MPFDPTPPHREASLTYLALAHHWPSENDRCTKIGTHYVCRRCVVLWPIALASGLIFAMLATGSFSRSTTLLVALCLPACVDFCLDNLAAIKYSPLRMQLLSIPLALGVGLGFARYFRNPSDASFWIVGIAFSAICGACALFGAHQSRKTEMPSR